MKMGKKHILVADDEQNILLSIQFILEVAGYEVDTAENGREALDKILAAGCNHVDLLITDIQMPRLTGLELIDELKRLGIDIPVIAITGYGNKKMMEELKRKGCNDYLDKPVDDEKLIRHVAIIMEKRNY